MKKTTLEKKIPCIAEEKNSAVSTLPNTGSTTQEKITQSQILRGRKIICNPRPQHAHVRKKILSGVWVFEKYVETTIGQRICDTIL